MAAVACVVIALTLSQCTGAPLASGSVGKAEQRTRGRRVGRIHNVLGLLGGHAVAQTPFRQRMDGPVGIHGRGRVGG